MAYVNVKVPEGGAKITIKDGVLQVPDNPILPFVEGDGTGRDIWRASVRVLDAAVEKAYGGKRKVAWMEVYAGEKSFKMFQSWLPEETNEAFREFLVGIKGPLTTPIGTPCCQQAWAAALMVPSPLAHTTTSYPSRAA